MEKQTIQREENDVNHQQGEDGKEDRNETSNKSTPLKNDESIKKDDGDNNIDNVTIKEECVKSSSESKSTLVGNEKSKDVEKKISKEKNSKEKDKIHGQDTQGQDTPSSKESIDFKMKKSNDTASSSSSSKTKTITKKSESSKPQKLKVHFVAVGSAPMMKKSKFLISPQESFARLQEKLSKMLQLNKESSSSSSATNSNSLFLYLHQSFVPSPEDLIGDLHDLFSVRGELVLHYSLQEAWG